MKFKRCDYVIIIKSTHQQQLMINEKQHHTAAEICEISTSNKNVSKKKFNSADSYESQQHQLAKVSEESHTSSVISEILKKYLNLQTRISQAYKKWKYLFQKEEMARALFIHQLWDHKIWLESDKQLMFESIYTLSEKKLKTLQKYLNENFKKEFIQKSESFTEYSILFISKKDESL